MEKYVEEVVHQFSLQSQKQIESVMSMLSIDQIKIIQAEILPAVKNIERRKILKEMLLQSEHRLYRHFGKEAVLAEALSKTESMSDRLKNIFDLQIREMLSVLKNDDIRNKYLQNASDDELYVLEKRLINHPCEEEKPILYFVGIEMERRKKIADEEPLTKENKKKKLMESYKQTWRQKNDNFQWETKVWKSLGQKVSKAANEVLDIPQVRVEKSIPKQEVQQESQSWFSKTWQKIKNFFSRDIKPVYKKPELTEKEQIKIEELRQQGAKRIAEVTGIVKVGEASELSEASRKTVMASRFGMVLASQVVAGSKSENHRILYTVVDSLAKRNDSDSVLVQLQMAIDGVTPKEATHPLRGNHALATGGNPEFVTAFESEVFKSILKSPEHFSAQGLTLTEKEKVQMTRYYENLERSRDMNHILSSICYSWGGYIKDASGYKKTDNFEKEQKLFNNKVEAASKSIQLACSKLKDGEALYLETSVENHAMQLVIKREGNEFKLSTYDSSGALENTSLSKGPIGLLKLSQLRQNEAKRKNALFFNVSFDKLISEEGLQYLEGLVRSNSMVGWAETKLEHNLQTKSRAERAKMWFPVRLYYDIQARKKFQIYIDKFTSLASSTSPPKFEEGLQHPQNTSNCFAKKAQSCEFYELGKATYKKLRLAMVLEQKNKLLKDIDSGQGKFLGVEYGPMIKDVEAEFLSPEELHELSMRLCEVKEPPSTAYYQNFFNALLDVKGNLEKGQQNDNTILAIQRIEQKIADHAQAYYNYLNKANRQSDIKAIFSSEVAEGTFNWKSSELPFKSKDGKIEPYALEKLSEFAAAQAWKASIQLLNHQIKRLSVNERHIDSENERLPKASLRDVKDKVTLKDLEEANVVNFTTGFTRQEEIKIEINVNGKRKEIDKASFFTLVANNKEALTNPKTMGVLDFLRNTSPDIEKRYINQVYPAQRKAFEEELELASVKTVQSVIIAIGRLEDFAYKIKSMRSQVKENMVFLKQSLDSEPSQNSIKYKNLEARLALLMKENEELKELSQSVHKKIEDFKQTTEGSAIHKITTTKDMLTSLRSSNEPKTINAVNKVFLKGLQKLEDVQREIVKTFKHLEEEEIEAKMNGRLENINHYRQQIIGNHLKKNAEFRIIDALASGAIGTENDRNRDMYKQSPSERAQFIKSARNTFLHGSVFQEIQSLNQKLRIYVSEVVEREIILATQTPEVYNLSALKSGNEAYAQMDESIKSLCKRSLPPAIKALWVKEMFAIWLKHEDPKTLYKISEKGLDTTEGVNQAFHHFLEQKANIKYGALKGAGFDIDLNFEQIEAMGWKPINANENLAYQKKLQEAANFIGEHFQDKIQQIAENTLVVPEQIKLTKTELSTKHDTSLSSSAFVFPEVVFLSKQEMETVDGGTLEFIRENPTPKPEGLTQKQCETYFGNVATYLQKIKAYNGLENKAQRLKEFCLSTAVHLFNLPYSPLPELISEISKYLLIDYRDEENNLYEGFLKLENNERSQILSALIKLQLTQISDILGTAVNSKFYSTIKQWEQLIIPRDEELSQRIAKLSSGGTHPIHIELFREVDTALHHSPVGLEGLYEGQKGLQIAITAFGKETPEGADKHLRNLADRLGMRNGTALLANQFFGYYNDSKILYSREGINSAQGRELFYRAFLSAFRTANCKEKVELLEFVENLAVDSHEIPCDCITPHGVFVEELLLRCANQDVETFNDVYPHEISNVPFTRMFVEDSTKPSITDGAARLFGFAKEINVLSLQIENALNAKLIDKAHVDELYSKLICSNLAYQLQLDQASDEELANLHGNFEFVREMSLVQMNMNKAKPQFIEFSANLTPQSAFFGVLTKYQEDKKFDGPPILANFASSSDIPGFICLGRDRLLDAVHGTVYVGNNKLGMMPAHLKLHIAVQELGLTSLPFRPNAGGYAYAESNEIKAYILQKSDGSVTIQRELMSFDGRPQMMQYLSPETMDSVPKVLKRGLNIEHFFIDADNNIFGYNSDFKPILKITKEKGLWNGVIIDHQDQKLAIQLDNTISMDMVQDLAKAFPPSEMLTVSANIIYMPSISKYITKVLDKGVVNYFITDSLSDTSSRRHLYITDQGSALTEKELTESEASELRVLEKKLMQQQEILINLTGKGDILAKQERNKVIRQIKEYESRVRELNTPETFIFITDSEKIATLEKEHLHCRDEMREAFLEFRNGSKKDREKLSKQYETAKSDYLQSKNELLKAYTENNPIRFFDVQGSTLQPKDFASILHVGTLAGKAPVLSQLLAVHVLKSPLKPREFEELKSLISSYQQHSTLSNEDREALIMLMGTELQHYIFQRSEAASGKIKTWDREAFKKLKEDFATQVKAATKLHLENFGEVWPAVQSEFVDDKQLISIFKPAFPADACDISPKLSQPLNINTKTCNMPIETMGGRTMVKFDLYKSLEDLMAPSQINLERRLQGLKEGMNGTGDDPIKEQEEGYYYENYGVFNLTSFEKLFSVTPQHAGLAGLTKEQVFSLFQLMQDEGWIKKIKDADDKFQITAHPSQFYSSAKISSFLTEIGFKRHQARDVSDRLEIFFYQTAVNGGTYTINEKQGSREELLSMVGANKERCYLEYLSALEKLEETLAKGLPPIAMTDLNAAYLINDYRKILEHYPKEMQSQVQIVLNNGMTRYLYYKTELDHHNDVQAKFDAKQDSSAIAMLHTRRNYFLDKLLESEIVTEGLPQDQNFQIEQDRKMQRAFLLFESEFGHRCNARQVNVFRGLLLDDELNPDKIDSAQARMGFGKTSLLPLVALYKTGEKLVRFVVPKSALETNTSDMSITLTNILGRRAVKDEFHRYRIATDPEKDMEDSPRLKSLIDAKQDLQKRLALYKRVRENHEVLVQSPSLRNSLECQAKIFLDMLMNESEEPRHQKELMECIKQLNEIRSLSTISVFDELDATQDPATTEVNYTSGKKLSLHSDEIYPLQVITQAISKSENKSPQHLGVVLLEKFGIEDDENNSILNFITSLDIKEPLGLEANQLTPIYLMRAILTDPVMLSVFTEKEPGTDFGVWFENVKGGSKAFDYEAFRETQSPLLIAVPYSAANIPKSRGSRFDNPEVTAITTFLYYFDPRTEVMEVPHLEFLIDSFRKGIGEETFQDSSGFLDPKVKILYKEISKIAEIQDPTIRQRARKEYFQNNAEVASDAFRMILARTIIQEQIKFDAGKANSNRYEQGSIHDQVIGFSGTAGDTSSYFKENMLDPAADGNMTLGIMGRADCQQTTSLDTTSFAKQGEDYNSSLVRQLAFSFKTDTRTLIDVGGLCKASNKAIALELALQLKNSTVKELKELKGVIYYDDVTNMKKLLILDKHNKENIVDLTPKMVAESDKDGSYFTYYDQSHSRGADIKQKDKAHAVLTLNFSVNNNDYKQAIMRMRKIVDKSLGQSFSTAVPEHVREKILQDLKLPKEQEMTGNDIAVWLRQKELQNHLNHVSVLTTELDSITKNAILQQQAALTQLMFESDLTIDQIQIFRECIKELNSISPFISGSSNDLRGKYGRVFATVQKAEYISYLQSRFDKGLTNIFAVVNRARESLQLPLIQESDKAPYYDMEKRIIKKREAQLSDEFMMPSSNSALSEAQSESESQSESQSQSQSEGQTQTHSFSEVATQEVVVEHVLRKHDIPFEAVSIDFLATSEAIGKLTLASKIPTMTQLFKDRDHICCSPSYNSDFRFPRELEQHIPPVRYFLAREKGNPKIILINQDEANLFMLSPVSHWTLYDIRQQNEGNLSPIYGPKIKSLENFYLLKKILLAASRLPVNAKDLTTIAASLEKICKPEQLLPTLEMKYETSKNITSEDAVFQLTHWGFCGEKQQNIQVKIEQTQGIIKEKYEKKGVTLTIGQGDEHAQVFISSKLNNRILDEAEKQEHGLVQPYHPNLKTEMHNIKTEYDTAIENKKNLKSNLKEIQSERQKIIMESDRELLALQEQRISLIQAARQEIGKSYESSLKNILNLRKGIQVSLGNNILSMCELKVGDSTEYGIKVFGKQFPSLDKAVSEGIQQLYQEHKNKPMSPEEILIKVDACVERVFQAVESRYKSLCNYQHNTKTVIEQLYEAFLDSNPLTKEKIENLLKKEMYDVRRQWRNTFLTPVNIWDQFIAVMEVITNNTDKNLSFEEFQEKIVGEISHFAKAKNMDVEKTKNLIIPRLLYSLTPGEKPSNIGLFDVDPEKKRNTAVIQSELKNVILRNFVGITNTPSAEQTEFYGAVNAHLRKKTTTYDKLFSLPPGFLDVNQIPLSRDEIKEGVKQSFKQLNVRISEKQIESFTDECMSYLLGRKSVEQTLENFKPMATRSPQLPPVEGKEAKMFTPMFETLAKLDKDVEVIQTHIELAQAQRKSHMIRLKQSEQQLRLKLSENKTNLGELKKEKSALNKLISGVKCILQMFKIKEVNLTKEDPIDFLNQHVDLAKVISSDASMTATLSFNPPEFYAIEQNIEAQIQHMHGFSEGVETSCSCDLKKAKEKVAEMAGIVEQRNSFHEEDLEKQIKRKLSSQLVQDIRDAQRQVFESITPIGVDSFPRKLAKEVIDNLEQMTSSVRDVINRVPLPRRQEELDAYRQALKDAIAQFKQEQDANLRPTSAGPTVEEVYNPKKNS